MVPFWWFCFTLTDCQNFACGARLKIILEKRIDAVAAENTENVKILHPSMQIQSVPGLKSNTLNDKIL